MSTKNYSPRSKKEFSPVTRLSVVALFAALLLPTVYFGNHFGISARNRSSQPTVPVSSPPEAFLMHSSFEGAAIVSGMVRSLGTHIASFISGPDLPKEFAIAKPPTFAERVLSSMSSLLMFVVPPTSAKSTTTSMVAVTAAGPVRFDFNNDGKADVGRWRSSNYEMKVAYSGSSTTATYTVGSSSSARGTATFAL